MEIGSVVNLPIDYHNKWGNNDIIKDTSCIVVNKKTYGMIRRGPAGDHKFLDYSWGQPGVHIFTYGILPSISIDDDASVCYELLVGDEKVWARQRLLQKYVILNIRIEF